MDHYIAYHNTEKMGRPLSESDPFRVLTSKPVERMLGQNVWFITSEGGRAPRYMLESVFCVTETGDAEERGFTHFAAGKGHLFDPPIPLSDEPWFADFIHKMGHFGLGPQKTIDERCIATLIALAREAGWEPL